VKVYMLKDEDFERLIAELEKDPVHSRVLQEKDRQVFEEAFRFFNYHVRIWISKVKE
jgi:hypothetical protein